MKESKHFTKKESPRRAGKNGGRKDRAIADLRRELAAERRKSARLERELSDLRRDMRENQLAGQDQPFRRIRRRVRGEQKQERLLDEANRRAHHYRKRSFLQYLWESVMESAPIAVISKLLQYLRRLRVVRIVISLVLAVGAVAAVAVLSAAVLPFLFVGTAILTLLAALRSHRMNRILRQELAGQHIRVMVPPRGASLSAGSFFIRNARAMAAEKGVTVLVVTPYLVSRRGLGGKGRFFTARKEADHLFLVRRHYFFVLRRRVLDALDGDMTVIY